MIKIIASALIFICSTVLYANNGYFSSTPHVSSLQSQPGTNSYSSSGYSSSKAQSPAVINGQGIFYQIPPTNLAWVRLSPNTASAPNLVIGGREDGKTYVICRTTYRGSTIPGKYQEGTCHFAWQDRELMADKAEGLAVASWRNLGWAPTYANNLIPPNAVAAGYENGQILYICQAPWRGNIISGKIWNRLCFLPWQGKVVTLQQYSILVNYL